MQIDTEQTPILEVTYQKTFQEFLAAGRAWSMTISRGRRIRYKIYVEYGFLTGLSLIIIGAVGLFSQNLPEWMQTGIVDAIWAYAPVVFPVLVGVGVVLLFNPWAYRRKCRKMFRQSQTDTEQQSRFYKDDVVIVWKNGSAESSFKWDAFAYWAESADVLVLILSQVQFLWFPKRAFSPEQQDQLRELLSAKIPVKKGNP